MQAKQGYSQRTLPAVQLPTIQSTRVETTIPRATPPSTTVTLKHPTEKVLEVLHSLLGISLDMNIATQEAHRPVGAGLQHFTELASYNRRPLDLEIQ